MPQQVTLDALNIYRFELRLNESGEVDILMAYVVHSTERPGLRIPGEVEFPSADLTTDERRALRLLMGRLRGRIEQKEGL